MKDTSQLEVKEANSKIDKIIGDLSSFEHKIKEYRQLCSDVINKEEFSSLNEKLGEYLCLSYKATKNLNSILKEKHVPTFSYYFNNNEIIKDLDIFINDRNEKLNNLKEPASKRKKRLEEIENEIKCLKDKKNLILREQDIKKCFSCIKKTNNLNKAISNLNTRKITQLMDDAYNGLLSDSLKSAFQEELNFMGKEYNVSIETKTEKCKVSTKLEIKGNSVSSILSDGEKKAVALAFFMAESKIDNNFPPLIFDDPVTSLDHEIRGKFAKRLIEISEIQQVIIFTHDLLFASKIADPNNIKISKHVIEKIIKSPGRVNLNTSPSHLRNLDLLREKLENEINNTVDFQLTNQNKLFELFADLRSACEALVEEKLFSKAIQRYDDSIKIRNLLEVPFSFQFSERIVNLHGRISEKISSHNHSAFKSEPSSPDDFLSLYKDFNDLYNDIGSKHKEIRKNRESNRKNLKTTPTWCF